MSTIPKAHPGMLTLLLDYCISNCNRLLHFTAKHLVSRLGGLPRSRYACKRSRFCVTWHLGHLAALRHGIVQQGEGKASKHDFLHA